MLPWIVSFGVVVLLLAVMAVVLPLRVEMTVRGRGEWGKMWVVAAGVQVAGFTVSFAAANEVESVAQLHLFGLRLFKLSPVRLPRKKRSKPSESRSLQQWLDEGKKLRAKVERWISLDDLLDLALGLRRYVAWKRFEGNIGYATPDYATTGMLLGALYSIAGLFVPLGNLRVEPIWEERASVHGDLKLEVRLWPVRALGYVLVFALKNVNFRRRPVRRAAATP